jgi:hypothetical protein
MALGSALLHDSPFEQAHDPLGGQGNVGLDGDAEL